MELLIIVFLTLLNGVFAMSEMALASARRAKLQKLADGGDRRAVAALRLMDDPTQFLSSVQVGITSIGLLNGILGEAAFSEALSTRLVDWGMDAGTAGILATAFVVAVITFVTIVFGELVPKRVGQLFPEAMARTMAIPMLGLAALTRPFVALLSGTTHAMLALLRVNTTGSPAMTTEEIEASLAEGLGAGVLEEHEHRMVQNVMELDKRSLTSIMLPRDDIIWLDSQMSVQDALVQVREHGHSWYPVCKGDWERVQGLVHVETLLRLAHQGVSDLSAEALQPAVYVPETLNGFELLEKYRVSDMRVVLVVDEYGVVQGMLTPRDLLEAITGELKTAEAEDAWAHEQADGSWLLDGAMPIAELKARLEIEQLPDEDSGYYNTVAGLLQYETGELLAAGAQVRVGAWCFEVMQVDGHRMEVVRAWLNDSTGDDAADSIAAP